MGRVTRGVRGIDLREGDYVVGMAVPKDNTTLFAVTEKGYGKRSEISEYKLQNRGGKGIRNYKISDKTGFVVGIRAVTEEEDIMLISSDGVIIRMQTDGISLIGRATQGVRLMRLNDDITIVNFTTTQRAEEEEETEETEE